MEKFSLTTYDINPIQIQKCWKSDTLVVNFTLNFSNTSKRQMRRIKIKGVSQVIKNHFIIIGHIWLYPQQSNFLIECNVMIIRFFQTVPKLYMGLILLKLRKHILNSTATWLQDTAMHKSRWTICLCNALHCTRLFDVIEK